MSVHVPDENNDGTHFYQIVLDRPEQWKGQKDLTMFYQKISVGSCTSANIQYTDSACWNNTVIRLYDKSTDGLFISRAEGDTLLKPCDKIPSPYTLLFSDWPLGEISMPLLAYIYLFQPLYPYDLHCSSLPSPINLYHSITSLYTWYQEVPHVKIFKLQGSGIVAVATKVK